VIITPRAKSKHSTDQMIGMFVSDCENDELMKYPIKNDLKSKLYEYRQSKG